MEVVLVEAGAIDGIFRPLIFRIAGGRGSHVVNGIPEGLDRELPDLALKYRRVGRRIDLIDSPEVGPAEIQINKVGDSIVGGIMVLLD